MSEPNKQNAIAKIIPEANLMQYEAMCFAIARCHDVDEVKEIHDKARAVEVYAKQARNLDAERKACDIRLRAERRTGELLKELQRDQTVGLKRGSDLPLSNDEITGKSEYAEALQRTGISRQTASRYQALADVPKETFEKHLSDPKERASTTKIIRDGSEPKQEQMNVDAIRVWGVARAWERHDEQSFDVGVLFQAMTETMQADMKRLVPRIADYWRKFAEVVSRKPPPAPNMIDVDQIRSAIPSMKAKCPACDGEGCRHCERRGGE